MMTEERVVFQNRMDQRIDPEDVFRFRCDPGVPCFTQCCQDVTIVLTPYDVLRLKGRLGIPSDDFIEKYTIVLEQANHLIPLVILKMNEADKRCCFVSQEGCRVYEDRPWPCRMYPLDMNEDGTLRLIADRSRCRGLNEIAESPISEWLIAQGIVTYDEMNHRFSQITSPLRLQETHIENPAISKMVFMALYNLDKFRDFVFKSTFLDRFVIEPKRVTKIKFNDIDLLNFGLDWIKYGIFGQMLFEIKQKNGTKQ